MHFVDSNIVVYALVSREPEKIQLATECLNDATISIQVLSELTSAGLRKYGLRIEDIDPIISRLEILCRVVTLGVSTLSEARRLTARYKLAYYDAQIIAAALEAGCDTLYSEDGRHRQEIEGLRIVNPFAD